MAKPSGFLRKQEELRVQSERRALDVGWDSYELVMQTILHANYGFGKERLDTLTDEIRKTLHMAFRDGDYVWDSVRRGMDQIRDNYEIYRRIRGEKDDGNETD